MTSHHKGLQWRRAVVIGITFFALYIIWHPMRERELTVVKLWAGVAITMFGVIGSIVWETASSKTWSWNRAIAYFLILSLGIPIIVLSILRLILD